MSSSIAAGSREKSWAVPAAASIAGALFLALAQHVWPPPTTRIFSILNNFGHGPAFGLLALLQLALLRPRLPRHPWLPYAGALVTVTVIGLALEALQLFTRRDASFVDAVNNAIGAGAFLCVAAYLDRSLWKAENRARWRAASLFTSAVLFMALISPVIYALTAYGVRAARFPTLVQFTTGLDQYFVELRHCSASLAEVQIEEKRVPALWMQFTRADYPGVALIEPVPDWRGFSRLRIEVVNPGEDRLTVGLRINDRGHGEEYADRFNASFEVEPGMPRVLDVPLARVESAPRGRRLDLSQVGGLVLFRLSSYDPANSDLMLLRVWLE